MNYWHGRQVIFIEVATRSALMKGTHYLLLKNADKLNDKQNDKLQRLLENNTNLTEYAVGAKRAAPGAVE